MTQDFIDKLTRYAKEKMPKKQTLAVAIDTINSIQDVAYNTESRKINFDIWRDYNKEIYMFYKDLQGLGFKLVEVLGNMHSGKSYGLKYFNENEFIWFNTDYKDPTWRNGSKVLGDKLKPKPGYHFVNILDYDIIIGILKLYRQLDIFADGKIPVYIMGHTEEYKGVDEESGLEVTKQRLKVLGNQARKQSLEGLVEEILYTTIKFDEQGKRHYYFVTASNGRNTCGTSEGLFESELIPNDLKAVTEAIRNY